MMQATFEESFSQALCIRHGIMSSVRSKDRVQISTITPRVAFNECDGWGNRPEYRQKCFVLVVLYLAGQCHQHGYRA